MAKRRTTRSKDWLAPKAAIEPGSEEQSSVLDLVDSLLNKGVMVDGDLVLGLAKVDLIYAKLSVLLSALDRVMNDTPTRHPKPKRRRT